MGDNKVREKGQKSRYSKDARLLIALMKKQPQTLEELGKIFDVTTHHFHYRVLSYLIENEIIKKVGNKGYALFTYTDLEEYIASQKNKYPNTTMELSLDELAREVRQPPEDVRKDFYRLAKKYDCRLKSKTKISKKLVNMF